jgi:hypothetical protein
MSGKNDGEEVDFKKTDKHLSRFMLHGLLRINVQEKRN